MLTSSLVFHRLSTNSTVHDDVLFFLRFDIYNQVNVNGALSDCWRPEDAERRVDQEGSAVSKYEEAGKERIHEGRKRQRGAGRVSSRREGIGECFLHVGLLLIGNV